MSVGQLDVARVRAGRRRHTRVPGLEATLKLRAGNLFAVADRILVAVLSGVRAQVDGRVADLGGPRQRRLLAALSVEPGAVLTGDGLIDRVWGNGDLPEDPRRALRTYLTRLRQTLGSGESIATAEHGWRLNTEIVDVDTIELASLVERSGDAGLDAHARLAVIDQSLALFNGGRPFGDLADEEWLRGEVDRLEELRVTLVERRFDAMLKAGKHTDAVPELAAVVEAHPLRERLVGLQMLALFRSARQAEASRVFQRHRERMAEELGLEPGAELAELDRQIVIGDPALYLGDSPGQALRGYRLGEQLGEGAFAMVYRGTQPSLGRDVAVKIIRSELANRPEFIRRFEAEAHLVARLEHPRVVPLYDYWREPDRAYLVFRYLRGGSLEGQLTQSGRVELDDARLLVEHVGAALTAAHRAGVIHRDVKPANVFLDDEGNYYLGDFGIALEAAELGDPTAALSAGSPAYAAPEQLRRERVGPTADVHGLGISLYEALTAQLPFPQAASEAELLQRQLNQPIPSVRASRPDLPAGIDEVLAQATAKDPADRFPTVAELVEAFVAELDGHVARSAEPSRRGSATAVSGMEERNPYKGLRAFTEADAADFEGRERVVDRMVEHLNRNDSTGRIVAVVGPSGIGKSSVVRAGLLPALRTGAVPGSDHWFMTTMLPGADPFEELATALLRVATRMPEDMMGTLAADHRGLARVVRVLVPEDSGAQLLLVLDQFEELFTLVTDPQLRKRFLDALEFAVTDARCPLRVVLTVRADFWDRPLRHGSFARLIEHSTVQVTALAADEVERAIVAPAAAVGCEFEPGLVSEIVADITDEPGALPLLQYSLTELWERRVSGLLTLDAYRRLGGVAGALARRAEQLHDEADPEERAIIRRLFGRLVTLGEGSEDTRRRVVRSELGDGVAIDAVIDRFGRARLLSFDRDPITREPTVEVAHEALLRAWPRLQAWLEEDRDELRVLRHLTEAARAWDVGGRDPGDLYRGGRLEATEELSATRPGELSAAEEQFLAESSALHRAESDREAEQYRQQVRSNRRLRQLLAGVAVLLALALVAGLVAFQQRGRAQQSEALAEQRAEEAVAGEAAAIRAEEAERVTRADSETRRMSADAARLADSDPQLALLLAVEAHHRAPDAETQVETLGGLQRVLTGVGRFLGFLTTDGPFDALAFTEDGALLAAGPEGLWRFDPDGTASAQARFQHDDARVDLLLPEEGVFTVTDGASTEVRRIADGTVAATLDHDEPPVTVIAQGDTLVALLEGGWIEIWDVPTGNRRARVHAVPETTFGEVNESIQPDLRITDFDHVPISSQAIPIALNGDGSVVAVGGSFLIRFFDTASGQRWRDDLLIRFELPGGRIHNSVAVSDLGFTEGADSVYGASPSIRFQFDLATGEVIDHGFSGTLIGQNPTVASGPGIELRRSGQVVVQSTDRAVANRLVVHHSDVQRIDHCRGPRGAADRHCLRRRDRPVRPRRRGPPPGGHPPQRRRLVERRPHRRAGGPRLLLPADVHLRLSPGRGRDMGRNPQRFRPRDVSLDHARS